MGQLYSHVQECISKLTPYFGEIDVRLSTLKAEREFKVRVMYNLIRKLSIPNIPASTIPAEVIKSAEKWAKKHYPDIKYFIKANVNYEGKKSLTEEFQKTEMNKIYWMAKEISVIDKKLLPSKGLANSVRLQSKVRGYGIRVSSLPVTTFPFWVRNHCYPVNNTKKFLYFDVSCAEFAHLLLSVNSNKYESLVLDSDLYLWVKDVLDLNRYDRQLIKQMTMALLCGATYKAVMSILKINEQSAKGIRVRFWELIPDVYEFLENTLLMSKLSRDGNSYEVPIKLLNYDLSNSVYIRDDNVDDNDQYLQRAVFASIVRDSFLVYYSKLLSNLFAELRHFKLNFAWVDSCLISITDDYDIKIILDKLKQISDTPLKIKYSTNITWGKASLDEKDQKVLIIK